MTILQFPLHGSTQYVEYLLAQREQLIQHVKLIDEVLREWNIVIVHDTDTGKTTWHRIKERKDESGQGSGTS